MIFALVLLIMFHHSFCLEDTANTCPINEYCQTTNTRIGALERRVGNILDILSSIRPALGCPACRSGYEYYEKDKICYKFHTDCKDWPEARQVCQKEGGDLLSLNVNNSNFFKDVARAKAGSCTDVWVGTTDVSLEGHWYWLNGEKVSTALWAKGQPENWVGMEHCGDLSRTFDYALNDEMCTKKNHFLCQADY